MLSPGTEVSKFGSSTGITFGHLHDVRNVYFGDKQTLKYAILIQWIPGTRFAGGGDSGSIYYAKSGSFWKPIAIHSGPCLILTGNYLSPNGSPNAQIMSAGTSLKGAMERFLRTTFYLFYDT